ncbi:nuclear transport factor 2 family protein [Frankia sp. CNm7]|uniref:Nuclear transport factor 2 family protein n=1 Tax=Frankia nepalensis TaxID=1836974 RepID=A0A937R8P8_9ACTN|nr:nuclear transport factor 2 family protein [Frankia nepalensis]MBL7496701.1 nuclear transport factor 2 family protein [Frankia nepalensis]MBL7511069.1 nuclear transport factor 2 family protein [Frankia nepalensis]MBL7516709.1 nuclear transport factor 2 family protein [Frankia nepalensis]MBL7627441.1 nuclear transport factor 2 family protein [Frankia nepalensis]
MAAYCRGVDRIDPELGRSVFHPDAVADYGDMFQGTGFEFIDFVCEAHRGFLTHTHQIGSISIAVDGDTAASECYVTARLRAENPGGGFVDILSYGRYVDRWARRDDVWRIAHRRYLHEMDETRTIEAGGFAVAGRRDRTDPSYEVLGATR